MKKLYFLNNLTYLIINHYFKNNYSYNIQIQYVYLLAEIL